MICLNALSVQSPAANTPGHVRRSHVCRQGFRQIYCVQLRSPSHSVFGTGPIWIEYPF